MDANLFKGNLDLILLSVLEREGGYGQYIAKRVNIMTEGQIKLNPGSLYPALHRLERGGFLEVLQVQSLRGGPPLKTYSLTLAGQQELARRQQEYNSFDVVLRGLWRGL